ncbi:MAG: RnfABCDGE type electron transport complex subunit G [Gammaproteobacteria bacterium]
MNSRNLLSNVPLVLLALLCILFIHLVHQLTRDAIKENERRTALQDINEVIVHYYDNDIYNDMTVVTVPASINPDGKLDIYFARHGNELQAMALLPVVAKGYSGPIKLIIGMNTDGSISGMRVISHRETPGFGAEVHQDKSDWLTMFRNTSLKRQSGQEWDIVRDGGKFDQLSGATITSRAVINTVHELLIYYNEDPDRFYRVQE